MIIEVVSATISPGKTSEAEDLWKRVASYDKKQPGAEDSIVMRPLMGLHSRISIATRFSSLTAWNEYRKKNKEDPEFQALLKEWREKQYTVPNTVERYVHQVVE